MTFDGGDIGIDEQALDREWLRQPRLYFRYAERLAMAKRELDEAKNEAAVTRAEVARMIRSSPESFGLAKATEASIEAAVVVQSEYQTAERAVVNKRYEVGIIEAAVQAIEHRKRALENLVSLHLSGYFSEPRAKPADREHVEQLERQYSRARGVKNDG